MPELKIQGTDRRQNFDPFRGTDRRQNFDPFIPFTTMNKTNATTAAALLENTATRFRRWDVDNRKSLKICYNIVLVRPHLKRRED
jgi:hypothetical protein